MRSSSAVLVCAGRLRDLLNWPHLAGVVLMLAIFAAWAVPYLQQTAADRAGGVWLAQFQGRLEVNEGFHLAAWVLNIPRGLVNYLPWAVLLPLCVAARASGSGEARKPPNARPRHPARRALGGGGVFPGGEPRAGRAAALHAAAARARERAAGAGARAGGGGCPRGCRRSGHG